MTRVTELTMVEVHLGGVTARTSLGHFFHAASLPDSDCAEIMDEIEAHGDALIGPDQTIRLAA